MKSALAFGAGVFSFFVALCAALLFVVFGVTGAIGHAPPFGMYRLALMGIAVSLATSCLSAMSFSLGTPRNAKTLPSVGAYFLGLLCVLLVALVFWLFGGANVFLSNPGGLGPFLGVIIISYFAASFVSEQG